MTVFENYSCSYFALGVYGLCPGLLEAFISLGSNWDLLGKNIGSDKKKQYATSDTQRITSKFILTS